MKNLPFLFFILLCFTLFSCNKDSDIPRKFSFLFFPREVKTSWVDYSTLIPVAEVNGVMGYAIEDFTGESLKADLLLLGLYTSNVVYDTVQIEKAVREYFSGRDDLIAEWPPELTHYAPIRIFQSYYFENDFTDTPEPNMEQKINDSYTKNANANSKGRSGGLDTPPQMFQDYRLTEIKNLTVTCNSVLFGIPSGSSLNQHFHINSLDPACVFSGNKQMALDHTQTAKAIKEGFSIDKWLSFRPLSATYFYFRLTSVPPELPVSNAVFTITMETVDGEVLECTGKPVNLAR